MRIKIVEVAYLFEIFFVFACKYVNALSLTSSVWQTPGCRGRSRCNGATIDAHKFCTKPRFSLRPISLAELFSVPKAAGNVWCRLHTNIHLWIFEKAAKKSRRKHIVDDYLRCLCVVTCVTDCVPASPSKWLIVYYHQDQSLSLCVPVCPSAHAKWPPIGKTIQGSEREHKKVRR